MNSAGSLNLTLPAIGGAGLAGVKIVFAPGTAPSGQVGASLTVAPACRSPVEGIVGIPPLQRGLARGAVLGRLSCHGSTMEDLDGVSALLSLPAASARPWSKARLDRLGTGCQGKSKARHGAEWVVGQETLDILDRASWWKLPSRHPPARTQLSLDGQRTPYELRIVAHGRILNAREGQLTG